MLALMLSACVTELVAVEALSVIHVAPSHGSTGVAIDSTLAITFSDDIDIDSLSDASLFLEDAEGTDLEVELAYDRSTYTVFVKPAAELDADTAYELVITDAVAGLQLGELPATLRSGFDTASGPAVNDRPIADAGEDRDDCVVGLPIAVDGGNSYDPESRIGLGFSWRMVAAPENAPYTLSDETGQTATLQVETNGEYVLGLVVDDGELASDEDYVAILCSYQQSEDTGL